MRRSIGALMIIPLLLFSGCAGGTQSGKAEELSASLERINSVELTAELSVDHGDRTAQFTLGYCGSYDSGTLTVLAPESIAGIKMDICDGRIKMDVNSVKLDSGELNKDSLAPVTIIPTVLEVMKSGYLTEYAAEEYDGNECTRLTYQIGEADDNALLCSLWINSAEEKPVYAEISVNGYAVARCKITEFSAFSG